LVIRFDSEGDHWQVVFDRNSSFEVTGEGDAQRIFATVLSAISQFVKEHEPQSLTFSASKDVDTGSANPESRAKLYNRLVQRYASSVGYKVHSREEGDEVVYLLRPNVAVAENFTTVNETVRYTDIESAKRAFATNPKLQHLPVSKRQDMGASAYLKQRPDSANLLDKLKTPPIKHWQDVDESNHQHTEIIRYPVGKWIVYLDNHSITRALTRGIGPRMATDIISSISSIPGLENQVPIGGAFWIQDNKTNSSFYFKRLDIPGEPTAVRCETGVKDVPRAGSQTPVFRVNAYTRPEEPAYVQAMKRAKLVNKFVGTNTMASTLSHAAQTGQLGNSPEIITKPETQDSKRYDRAFAQHQQNARRKK